MDRMQRKLSGTVHVGVLNLIVGVSLGAAL